METPNKPPFNEKCDHRGFVVPFIQEVYPYRVPQKIIQAAQSPAEIITLSETHTVICSNCGDVWAVSRPIKTEGNPKVVQMPGKEKEN